MIDLVTLGASLMVLAIAGFAAGSLNVAKVAKENLKWPDLPIGMASTSYVLRSIKPSNIRIAGPFSVWMICLSLSLGLVGSVVLSVGLMSGIRAMMNL